MLEQLLKIQLSCFDEGAVKTAQLLNQLMAHLALVAMETAPEPAKPKQPERQYNRTQKDDEAVIHTPTVKRLFNEKRRQMDISGHKLANHLGFASQSNIPGLRTRDRNKEFVSTAQAARLVEIFGTEILAKDNPSLGES